MQAAGRRVEFVEGQLVDRLGDLAADAAHRPGFVDHQQAVRLPDAGDDRLDVERHDRARIDDLGLDALRGERLRRFERALHHLAGRDDGDVGAGARDARDAERHVVLARRHLALGGKQRLRLQHDDRIARPAAPSSSGPWRRPAWRARRR